TLPTESVALLLHGLLSVGSKNNPTQAERRLEWGTVLDGCGETLGWVVHGKNSRIFCPTANHAGRSPALGSCSKVSATRNHHEVVMKTKIKMRVNGVERQDEVEPRLLLVHYLRDVASLTGTHVGCETSICGACTVLLDGQAVKSCTI